MVAVSENGVNVFFVRNDLLPKDMDVFEPKDVFGPKKYPNGTLAPTEEFWEKIKELPFVDVTQDDAHHTSKGAHVSKLGM